MRVGTDNYRKNGGSIMSKYLVILVLMFSSLHSKSDIADLVAGTTYRVVLDGTEFPVSVSVIIPCHPAHAKHLYRLLRVLEEQTVLPDEVVISLSEYDKAPSEIIAALEQCHWLFPVTIILSQEKLYAGQNRNVASRHAIGDVFIYQDADDEPHKRRIEIVKFFFHIYELEHLMHKFAFVAKEIDKILYYDPEIKQFLYLRPLDYASFIPGKHVTNGNIAISRELFNKYPWPDHVMGEDEMYNRMLYELDVRRLIIMTPLFIYRHYLSTSHHANTVSLGGDVTMNFEHHVDKEHQTKIICRT